jgi:hypothetical protein
MFGALIPFAIIAVIAYGIRASRRGGSTLTTGQQVRYFFQHLILLVAVLVTTAGLAGTIGPIVDRATFVATEANDTALNLAMLILGAPITALLSITTRRRLATDRTEIGSFGWSLFVTIGTVAPLIVALFGGYRTLLFVVGTDSYDGAALAQLIVWTGTWLIVRRVDHATSLQSRIEFRHVVPALVGLVVAAVALGQIVSGLVQRILDATSDAVFVPTTSLLHRGLALFVVGATVWTIDWLRSLSRETNSDAWRFVVVLFGIAGGLITAIVSLATATYQVAVWLVGSPQADIARTHFEAFPESIGGLVAGLLVWWYHRTLLADRRTEVRTEIDRVYEHVMAAGGLLASAVGVVILVVAVVEAITGTRIIRGDTAVNTLLLSLILLAIGIPVWVTYWRASLHREAADERGSITRRVYVVTLLGVGGLVALGSAIATVYLLLRDVIEGNFATSTLRALRYPLAILLTSGAVSGYHVRVFRDDHLLTPTSHGRRRIVIAGPADARLDSALRAIPHLDVEWTTTTEGTWPVDDVVAAIRDSRDDLVVVLGRSGVTIARI